MTKIYVCDGTCHGTVTEAQWKAGKHTCGAKGCTLFGKPLVPKK